MNGVVSVNGTAPARLRWMTDDELTLTTHANGSFTVAVAGVPWLSSVPPRLHVNGGWATLSLLPEQPTDSAAADATWRWSATGPSGAAVWETSVSVDGNAAIFAQTFLEDANGTASDGVLLSEFPSVRSVGIELGFVMGAGMDGGPRAGNFSDADSNASRPAHWSGEQGGPMALFDREMNTLVVSPASEFLSTMMSGGDGAGELAVGVSGSVTQVPKGHRVQTIMMAGKGVRDTFVAWGDKLMAMHGKARTLPAHSADPIVTQLGYSLTGCYQYNRAWQTDRACTVDTWLALT